MNLRRAVLAVLAALPFGSVFAGRIARSNRDIESNAARLARPVHPTKWVGEIDVDLIHVGSNSYADGTPLNGQPVVTLASYGNPDGLRTQP